MNQMQYQPNMPLQTAEEKQMGLFIHLSQLANLVFFPVGIIIPIVLWTTQKEKMPALDAHGKMVTNWLISSSIYLLINLLIFIVGFILTFVFVGVFVVFFSMLVFIAIATMGVIFSIVGGIKANNGELWEYPMTIKFLK